MTDEPTNDSPGSDELTSLIESYCDGTIDDAGIAQLESALSGNKSFQRLFLARVDLHARLCWEGGRGQPAQEELRIPIRSAGSKPAYFRWFVAAASIALLVSLSFLAWKSHDRSATNVASVGPGSQQSPTTVTVVNAAGLRGDQVDRIRVGATLPPGLIELSQGIVELNYPSGVRLILESPAKLELVNDKRAFLHGGRLVARVPNGAIGFVVDTSRAEITDLGTEFGVEVRPNGGTQVQVYEGKVDAGFKDAGGKPVESDRLVSGEARAFIEAPKPLNFVPHRFVRSFPVVAKEQRPELLTGEPQVEMVHVGRAAKPPTIDGDLADWDRGRSFMSRCLDPNSDRYYVQGMMMCDDQRLYVAAHVGDPFPMASMADADQEPSFYWTGGSIVLRLAAGKPFTWPLDAARQSHDHEEKPADLSDQIVHVGLWYSRRLNQPQLALQYGMDCHGQLANPSGWKGAFRKDPDGLGYTAEYAIDLSLLHAAAPPKPGDVWPANWTVHWSDVDGRTCMGQLTEITNSGKRPYETFKGETWGKVIFEDH